MLVGSSAGGQLVLLLSALHDEMEDYGVQGELPVPVGTVAQNPATDMESHKTFREVIGDLPLERYNPVDIKVEKYGPVLLQHSTKDEIIPYEKCVEFECFLKKAELK